MAVFGVPVGYVVAVVVPLVVVAVVAREIRRAPVVSDDEWLSPEDRR
jgi:hypothetical protein